MEKNKTKQNAFNLKVDYTEKKLLQMLLCRHSKSFHYMVTKLYRRSFSFPDRICLHSERGLTLSFFVILERFYLPHLLSRD